VLTASPDIDPADLLPASLFSSFDIAARRCVVVAVSGGSDSTALLSLTATHVRHTAPATRLVAATVDHALRAGSAREAELVGDFCRTLGVEHHTLTWTGEKPKTGLLAAAREARHDLLAGLARREGSDLVLTGHTADDQAETVLMRGARSNRKTDTRGLAGIAPATLFDGDVWFARPVLDTRRAALRAYLTSEKIGWIDDPTNVDERYERPAMRKRLADDAGGTEIDEALQIARDAAQRRIAIGREAARLIGTFAERPAPGLLRLRPDFLDADHDAALYALRILLAVAGGTGHLPDEQRSAALHQRLAQKTPMRAVLSRALVDSRAGGVFLLREARNLPEWTEGAISSAIWDGRYRILLDAPTGSVASSSPPGASVPDSLVRKAAAAEPPVGKPAKVRVMAPWARYLPSFDLAPARAVASLIDAGEIPAPPFAGHD
jgi:tRNA(Ile)-lysidine synthase